MQHEVMLIVLSLKLIITVFKIKFITLRKHIASPLQIIMIG